MPMSPPRNKVRLLSAWLILASLLAISTGVLVANHAHVGFKQDACSVCKASDLPSLTLGSPVSLFPPTTISESAPDRYSGLEREAQANSLGSRAPPVA